MELEPTTSKKNSEQAPLEGYVAQIISEREIAINIGKKHGVKKGMRFAVLSPTPQIILDPITEEELDILDREKVRVEVTEVRTKISICSTYRTYRVGGGALAGLFGNYSLFEPARIVHETLKYEDSQLPAPLLPEESYVKIGDRVKELIENKPREEEIR